MPCGGFTGRNRRMKVPVAVLRGMSLEWEKEAVESEESFLVGISGVGGTAGIVEFISLLREPSGFGLILRKL